MTTTSSLGSELRETYSAGMQHIRQQFVSAGDGRAAVAGRTALVEGMLVQLWKEVFHAGENGPGGLALVAVGGFGRGWLFPFSDIDLLFLHGGSETEAAFKTQIRAFSQQLWDLRLKLSPAVRTLAECDHFDCNNSEFTVSLLDCRYLAGDGEVFHRLREIIIPRLIARESQRLTQSLADLVRERHARHGNTMFHLEPNVKETPGGLRDYNAACWLAQISVMEKLREWPSSRTLLPAPMRRQFDPALEFLFAIRCFLHFRSGRDENVLSWEAQDEAARASIGFADAQDTAGWMRIYFSHARAIHRGVTQLLDEIPAAWSSLHRQFQHWRSRLSNQDFSVVDGLIFLQRPSALQNPEMLLLTFHFMARHGLKLSATTESHIEQVLPALAATPPRGAELWLYLQEILVAQHGASALRAMQALRLLGLLLPELQLIDALVVRDFYHRFTVDEHSFLAIESLHKLRLAASEWDQRYQEILEELEQPELLYLALLLHDVGKGVPGGGHVQSSLEIAGRCMDRLDLEPKDRETVSFLIANHLEMSAASRRDIFDRATVRAFAELVGVQERLKMLCLLTYADVKAVNPDALTPWKAENLWQLYIATSNYLNHSVDQRLHLVTGNESMARLHALAPAAGKKLKTFLEGLPQRYLQTYPPDVVLRHAEMAANLVPQTVQLDLKRGRHWYELTLVTADRPSLFATMAGALAAWGMNIVKASAFSNQAGIVVDTFYFTDRFRTLELNLPEWERFRHGILAVLNGKADLQRMLRDRLRSEKNDIAKVKIETAIEFDNQCSGHSTLVQVIAQDRLGLLHAISSRLSQQQCNIEIAIIDTEGLMAIDVFYLTSSGAKLNAEHQKRLQEALLQ